MKTSKPVLTLLLVALIAAAAHPAWAHGDRHRGRAQVGVYFGTPMWPWYSPPPWYYYPQVITVPAPPPPVYIEQAPPPSASQSYWYFCGNPEGYYPYVKECPGGWQKVAPQP